MNVKKKKGLSAKKKKELRVLLGNINECVAKVYHERLSFIESEYDDDEEYTEKWKENEDQFDRFFFLMPDSLFEGYTKSQIEDIIEEIENLCITDEEHQMVPGLDDYVFDLKQFSEDYLEERGEA